METFLMIIVTFLIGLFVGILIAIKYTNSEQTELDEIMYKTNELISDKIAVIEELRGYIKQLDDRLNNKQQG
jgi:maltodextrin utilization protein YvdJ